MTDPDAGLTDQLHEIINQSPAVSFIWRLEAGWPVEYVSDNIRNLGYEPEAFLDGALQFAEIVHPDDLERVGQEVEQNLAAGTERFYQRYRVITASGEIRWIDDWTSVVRNPEGRPVTARGVILDVTDKVNHEEEMHRYFESVGAMYLRLDRDGHVLDVNQRTCIVTQRTREELLGCHWINEFVPDDVRTSVNEVTAQIYQGAMSDPGESTNEIEVAGERLLIRWHFTTEHDDAGNEIGMTCFGHDITHQVRAEEHLLDIVRGMPGAVFDYTLHADGSEAILFLNDECENLWEISRLEVGDNPGRLWEMVVAEDLAPMQQSIMQSAESLNDWMHEWRIVTRAGRSKWLQGRGRPRRFSNGDTRWSTTIVDITEAKQSNEAKLNSLRQSIYALAAVVEARDPYTAGHEENVARLSAQIGRALGLSEIEVEGLELAAMVHDIGKISVPAEILSKPTRLVETEYEMIKLHAEIGAKLLRDIDFAWPIADIIAQHHERMDGSGYPAGLKGNEILIEARVLAVADTLESITSHRPYRPKLERSAVLDVLIEERGAHLDPQVVDATLQLIDQGEIQID